MIEEHKNVFLLRDLPKRNLIAGDVGVVVHVHKGGEAYEVEFMTFEGETVAVCTLDAKDIRALEPGVVPHVREMAV